MGHLRDTERNLYLGGVYSRAVVPAVAEYLGGEDPLAPMSRTHLELFHLTSMLERLVDDLPDAGPSAADRTEARRIPSAIAAILGLLNLADAQQVLTGARVHLHDHSRKLRHLVVPALRRPVRDVVPDGAEHLVGAA